MRTEDPQPIRLQDYRAPDWLVDTVEPAVIPVMLGEGIPMATPSPNRATLRLTNHRLYKTSGIMLLEYAVEKKTEPRKG